MKLIKIKKDTIKALPRLVSLIKNSNSFTELLQNFSNQKTLSTIEKMALIENMPFTKENFFKILEDKSMQEIFKVPIPFNRLTGRIDILKLEYTINNFYKYTVLKNLYSLYTQIKRIYPTQKEREKALSIIKKFLKKNIL